MIVLTMGRWVTISTLAKDARKHRSPNAGWPEAAMALVLNVSLSGPRSYHGQIEYHPFVNETGRQVLFRQDIENSVFVLWAVWTALVFASIALWGIQTIV